MILHGYVDPDQVGAFGSTALRVGNSISVSLIGYRGGTVDAPIRPMPCYISTSGRKTLTRTGLLEYAFSGQILESKKRKWIGSIEYREVLLDCGLRIIFAEYFGRATGAIEDLEQPANREFTKGRYLSGLMLLCAHIVWSFRDPPLLRHVQEAHIVSIEEIDLSPNTLSLGKLNSIKSVAPQSSPPLILGLEFRV